MDQKLGVVTTTHRGDLDAFKLLIETLDHRFIGEYHHYVIVDQRDVSFFKEFQSKKRTLILSEDLLPYWIFRMPGVRKLSFSFYHLPIRNWFLQQLLKLSVPEKLSEEFLLYIDSDVSFFKPFDLASLFQNDRYQLFKIQGKGNIPSHYKWHHTAAHLLGIPAKDYFGARYIGNAITWRKSHVLGLHRFIEKTLSKSWQHALCSNWHFSEYILYGIYCDQVLKEKSSHFPSHKNICLEWWDQRPFTPQEEKAFIASKTKDHVCMMITSKAKVDRDKIKKINDQLSL